MDEKEYDILYDEVSNRIRDLRDFEFMGESSETAEIKIFEKIRDEFQDSKYEDILIDLGINDNTDDDDLISDKEEEERENKDHSADSRIMEILLVTKKDIDETNLRLRGLERVKGKIIKRRPKLAPEDEIRAIIGFLSDNFTPQNLVSKLRLGGKQFISNINMDIHKILDRLQNYPDSIVDSREVNIIIASLLSKIKVALNTMDNGRLGDLARDMIIKSYNEKNDVTEQRKNDLKEVIG